MRHGMILLGSIFLGGCDTQPSTSETDDALDVVVDEVAEGAEVFDANCADCHGADGSGDVGPSLFERVPSLTAREIVQLTTDGQNYMPAIELTEQERQDVADFAVETWGDD